jgi:hypothetical protein
MPFEYACFISYPHGQRELLRRMVEDLYEALSNEIECFFRSKKIFLDEKELIGGDRTETLAKSLCKSICMIVVFTPAYFDEEHTCCAREFKAMEKLEKARLKYLKKSELDKSGLIIPIIFRGKIDDLPMEIRKRQYYFFADFLLSSEHICKHDKYAGQITEIAERIHKIYKISAVSDDFPKSFENCDKFRLPEEEEIKEWLGKRKTPKPKTPFPGD